MLEGISIIVAEKNQSRDLIRLVDQIINYSKNYQKPIELIIVRNGKDQKEISLPKDEFIKVYSLKDNCGSGKARHFGAKKSQFDKLMFIDADIIFDCDFLKIIDDEILENDGIIGVVNSTPSNKSSLTSNYIAKETNFYGNNCEKKFHNFFICLCGVIKSKVYFSNVGLYHNVIDDMEFSSRLDEETKIKTVKKLNFFHKYDNLLKSSKKNFLRSYHFAQLSKKPFSPWFTKIRKFSTLLTILITSFVLISPLYLSESILLTLSIAYLVSCYEILKFKEKNFFRLLAFPFIKYVLQLSAALGYIFGLIKKIITQIYHKFALVSGPLRIYLRKNKPTYLILYITGRCNSKCSYCFQWELINVPKRVSKELTLKEYEIFSKNLGPLEHLTLGGGEPTLRKDMADIAILFYKNCGVRNISVPTNGIRPDLLESHVEKILSNCPNMTLKVSLSIDGYEKEHDKLRGVTGNYERLIESDKVLRILRKKYKNLYYIINTCFVGQNQKNIMGTIKKNKEQFDHDIQVSTFVRGTLADSEDSQNVDINEYFKLVDYLENVQTIEKKKHKYSLDLMHQALQVESRSSIKHIMKKGEGKYGCTAGKAMAVIDELGNVNPCEVLPSKFGYGNLRDYSFSLDEMLKEKKVKNTQKRIKNEKCFCTWECAQLNSIVFSPKGFFNMFKHMININKRRKILDKLGKNFSFETYSKFFPFKEEEKLEYDKFVHPMVKEGDNENPFIQDQSKFEKEENNLNSKEQIRDKKKENWLKPVKASKIPSTYQYK